MRLDRPQGLGRGDMTVEQRLGAERA